MTVIQCFDTLPGSVTVIMIVWRWPWKYDRDRDLERDDNENVLKSRTTALWTRDRNQAARPSHGRIQWLLY